MEERRRYRTRRQPEEAPPRSRRVRRAQAERPYPEERRTAVQPAYPYAKQGKKNGKRMDRRRQKQRRQRRGGVLLVVALILILAGSYAAAKFWVMKDRWEGKAEQSDFVASASGQTRIQDVINVAVFGTDEDGFRADVDLLVSFHTKTGELNLISVPRDTCVTMTDEMIAYLEEKGAYVPQQHGVYGQCKLTEVHAYAGEGNRCAFSVAMMEELLGVEIDHYVKVDLNAFRRIVDAVGGVDFEVPERLYYVDPYQDLYIDLQAGMQHLDGEKAEQLVRFREGYAQKDLRRIQVQQAFIQALIQKVCSTDTILNNLNDLVQVVLDCTESDITMAEALQYVKYINQIDLNNITSDTVPTDRDPGSYYYMDAEATKELIDQRVYGIELAADGQDNTDGQTTTNGQNG